MQTLEEKAEAIKSLLLLVWIHLDFLPMALKVSRYGNVTPPDGTEPPPAWKDCDCDGLCSRCGFEPECKGEWWAVVQEKMRRRYRLEAISRSMDKLMVALPFCYRAVVAVYVDPYDNSSEPVESWKRKRRAHLARKGVEWMAREIPDDIPAFGEKRPRDKRIVALELLEQGFTHRQVQRMTGYSSRTVWKASLVLSETYALP